MSGLRSARIPLLLMMIVTASIFATPSPRLWVGRFSVLQPGASLPWKPWRLDSTRSTRYRLERVDGRTALRADSDRSASALIREVDIDPSRFPVVHWSWRTLGPLEGGSWSDRATDDFPLRLFLIFEKKGGFFTALRRALAHLGSGFGGRALNYVWSEVFPGDRTIGRSPVSDRVAMVATESGRKRIGRWVDEERNWVEDYRTAFGEDPGRVVAVAVMTDSDNTGGRVTSFFGDIYFSKGRDNERD